MSAETLRQLMDKYGLNEIDIAAGTKLDPTTIERFLKTGKCNPSTNQLIVLFMDKVSLHEPARAVHG